MTPAKFFTRLLLPLLPFSAIYAQTISLRPPATPLVACDPYFSIWSRGDRLTDVPTTHWTGRPHRLTSLVRIDGHAFRLMGDQPASVPAMPQLGFAQVTPTRTIYRFAGSGIDLRFTFTTPALPTDLDLLSRPVTYLNWEAKASDGRSHEVRLYFDASPEITVDEPTQQVRWTRQDTGDLVVARAGSVDQPVLRKTGDDRRIDWGYLYVAAPRGEIASSSTENDSAELFARGGTLPSPVRDPDTWPASEAPVAAFSLDLGAVGSRSQSRWLMLAYDDLRSIQYFRQDLRPYWRRNGAEAADLLRQSQREHESIERRCARFDDELMSDLRKSGGERYALLAALAFRQCLAGNKLAADANGQPLLFPKENTSNGCIGTVDVIFPMAPEFLLFGPSLTKAMIVSNLDYASSPRWRWPFAPHDLGTYPRANGQVYGGGERTEEDQMPVEETGNMLILTAALSKMEGNAEFARHYWPTLTRWAEYLRTKGFDPEKQLSTDDFMGHLGHQTNLSIKATLGLGAYSLLCEKLGDPQAAEYRALAKLFADRWVREAADGDHFRLAFDKPGSWSQKYNLVWDRILGLNLYPASVGRTEMAFYRKMLNPYGVPLDSRAKGHLAKADWSLWSGTLTGDRADFEALADPVFRYANESPQRVPFGDAYDTATARHMFMHSRPVMGGAFLKLLYEPAVWQKWAARDVTRSKNWAPLPVASSPHMLLPTSEREPARWRYTTSPPDASWSLPSFADAGWSEGLAPFGTQGTPGISPGTTWSSSDIWLRREFTLAAGVRKNLLLMLYHDEDAEVYLNGVLIAKESGYVNSYDEIPLGARAAAAFRPGRNVIAVHCHQTTGGQGIDVGIGSRGG